ncbi:hypothetical protein F5Y17DRAFT_355232 [Xylariaceae sp. FL0594]|nr:hypothetical protein F5Y17DRAFT_355232 [Xylariaceae sp. FL0594]
MEALAPRAVWKSAYPCPHCVTRTFPVIAANTIILGICGVHEADPQEDGWFLSDFYAFNYLLRGLGSHQTWLSATSPRDLLRTYGRYCHGNPYQPRRVVLSDTLLDEGNISMPTVLPRDGMKRGVLETLTRLSDLSHEIEAPLLVLVFGHRQPEDHSLFIESYEGPECNVITHALTIEDFRRATTRAKHVSLITTAYFSGGWALTPDLRSWPESPSSENLYGSIFASSATCFLTDQTRETGDMPTFNKVCRTLRETLDIGLTRFREAHVFQFSACDYNYGGAWSAVSALPFTDFETRWNALETSPPAEPSVLDQDPPTSSLFGSTFKSQIRFVKQAVRYHFSTCQGDWEMVISGKHRVVFGAYLRNQCPDEAATRQVLQLLEWRNGAMELADTFVEALQLSRPAKGQTCAQWDRRLDNSSTRDQTLSRGAFLKDHGFEELIPETHACEFNKMKGSFCCGLLPFSRPRFYVALCMVLGGLKDAEIIEALERCKMMCQEV